VKKVCDEDPFCCSDIWDGGCIAKWDQFIESGAVECQGQDICTP